MLKKVDNPPIVVRKPRRQPTDGVRKGRPYLRPPKEKKLQVIGLHCPNCGRKHECPCGACSKGRMSEWKFDEHDGLICKCGFGAHVDWWLDLEMAILKHFKVMK